MFVGKLTLDLNLCIVFLSSHREFQELDLCKMIGNARHDGGLHFLDAQFLLAQRDQNMCLNSTSTSSVNDILYDIVA